MTDRPVPMNELLATDALLDSLGAREPSAASAGDPALAALRTLAAAVDERPVPALPRHLDLATTPTRHTHRSRGVGLLLAGVLTVTSGGIAAAVAGDPLMPIKVVVHHLYGVDDPAGPDSNWILGGRRQREGAHPGSTVDSGFGPHARRLVQESRHAAPWDDLVVTVRDGVVPHPESKVVHVVPASHAHHDPAGPPSSTDDPADPQHTDTGGNPPAPPGNPRDHRPAPTKPTGPTSPGDQNGDSADPGDDGSTDGGDTPVMRPAQFPAPQDPCQSSPTGSSTSTTTTSPTPPSPPSCSLVQLPQPMQPAQPTQPAATPTP